MEVILSLYFGETWLAEDVTCQKKKERRVSRRGIELESYEVDTTSHTLMFPQHCRTRVTHILSVLNSSRNLLDTP